MLQETWQFMCTACPAHGLLATGLPMHICFTLTPCLLCVLAVARGLTDALLRPCTSRSSRASSRQHWIHVYACAQGGAAVQVLLAGAAGEVCSGVSTPDSNKSYLVNFTPEANHSIVEEEMAFPRVVCLFFLSAGLQVLEPLLVTAVWQMLCPVSECGVAVAVRQGTKHASVSAVC